MGLLVLADAFRATGDVRPVDGIFGRDGDDLTQFNDGRIFMVGMGLVNETGLSREQGCQVACLN